VNNPFTGTAYANDTIPTISPVAQTLLSYYPLPNANGNGYNYQALAPIPSNTTAGICVWTKPHLEAERLRTLQLEGSGSQRRRKRADGESVSAERDGSRPESQPAGVT